MPRSAKTLGIVVLAAALASPLLAGGHPDFTGKWKLNESGRAPGSVGPRGIVFQIEHKEPRFKYAANGFSANGAPFSEAYEFTTDGQPPAGDAKVKAVGRWDGPALVVDYIASGKTIFQTRLALSADGMQMTRDTTLNGKPLGLETYDRQ